MITCQPQSETWEAELPAEFWHMPWAQPRYRRDEVDSAGKALLEDDSAWDNYDDAAFTEAFEQWEHALRVTNNWRSAHSFPLNTFQATLRRHARVIDGNCLVAQRIKRLPSILAKLKRFNWLTLSEIQDIGGCRAVMSSLENVRALVLTYETGDLKHKLVDSDDYITKPKGSGYRSVHLIYSYFSDRKETYNGLKIEMQLRSTLQHAWATAVETVGTFTRQALKSSRGEQDWLRFFSLMGAAIARREKTPPVPNTPTTSRGLVRELRQYASRLEVERRLRAYGSALNEVETPGRLGSHYFLLSLDPNAQRVEITGYKAGEFERASEEYLRLERAMTSKSTIEAVLVSVDSISGLRRAFPNYFLDTNVFLDALQQAIK